MSSTVANQFLPLTHSLPLDTIQLALTELVVKVEQFSTGGDVANKNNADDRVLAFLREQTLLGILPPSPPIRESRTVIFWSSCVSDRFLFQLLLLPLQTLVHSFTPIKHLQFGHFLIYGVQSIFQLFIHLEFLPTQMSDYFI